MRRIPEPPEGLPDDDPAIGYLDWKDRPGTVLENVDTLLAAHGLEIVEYETGGDWHNFKIEKREAVETQ